MTSDGTSPRPPSRPLGGRGTAIAAALLAYVGLCEVLATTPAIAWQRLPDWFAMMVLPVGFFAVLLLASFIGNMILAIGCVVFPWRVLGRPVWQGGVLSIPFWIVTYRLSPKPW